MKRCRILGQEIGCRRWILSSERVNCFILRHEHRVMFVHVPISRSRNPIAANLDEIGIFIRDIIVSIPLNRRLLGCKWIDIIDLKFYRWIALLFPNLVKIGQRRSAPHQMFLLVLRSVLRTKSFYARYVRFIKGDFCIQIMVYTSISLSLKMNLVVSSRQHRSDDSYIAIPFQNISCMDKILHIFLPKRRNERSVNSFSHKVSHSEKQK